MFAYSKNIHLSEAVFKLHKVTREEPELLAFALKGFQCGREHPHSTYAEFSQILVLRSPQSLVQLDSEAWFPYRRKRRGRVPVDDRRYYWDAYD